MMPRRIELSVNMMLWMILVTISPLLCKARIGEIDLERCNAALSSEPCDITWSSLFGARYIHSKTVVIPCGKCVVMDHVSRGLGSSSTSSLILESGLDVQGKLIFNDGYALDLITRNILVQGELHVPTLTKHSPSSTTAAASGSLESRLNITFSGYEENQDTSDSPIVVSGGKLVIRGSNNGAARDSWTIVHDNEDAKHILLGWLPASEVGVSSYGDGISSYVPPRAASPKCSDYVETGVLLEYDFSDLTDSASSAKGKTNVRRSSNSLFEQMTQYQRIHRNKEGPQISLESVMPCLEAGRPYLVTAQVRMSSDGGSDLTRCAKSGQDCVKLLTTSASEQRDGARIQFEEQQSHQSQLGRLLTIATTMTFQEQESNILFRGGPTDLQLIALTIEVPSKELFRDTFSPMGRQESDTEIAYCPSLVPPNANAELAGLHPFPFGTNNPYTHLVALEHDQDPSDHYFAVTGRSFSMHAYSPNNDEFNSAGMFWDVPSYCLNQSHQTGALYRYVS